MISLLSLGSPKKGTPRYPVQKSTSIENSENVPSEFPISREIAKTIHNRVGRKMSLFTSKMMDFLFPIPYLMSHRMTDNGNSEKQAADKHQISELISIFLFLFMTATISNFHFLFSIIRLRFKFFPRGKGKCDTHCNTSTI